MKPWCRELFLIARDVLLLAGLVALVKRMVLP